MMFIRLIYRKVLRCFNLPFADRRAMMVKIERGENQIMNIYQEMALLRNLGNVSETLEKPNLTPWARNHWTLTKTILQRKLSRMRVINNASSSNGRTMNFDFINRGSNP